MEGIQQLEKRCLSCDEQVNTTLVRKVLFSTSLQKCKSTLVMHANQCVSTCMETTGWVLHYSFITKNQVTF